MYTDLGLSALIIQEPTGERTISLVHAFGLNDSYANQSTDISNTFGIDHEFVCNIKMFHISHDLSFLDSFGQKTHIERIVTTIFMNSDLQATLDDLLDDETIHPFSITHNLQVFQEATKTLSTDVEMVSEFFVFKIAQGEDYGDTG